MYSKYGTYRSRVRYPVYVIRTYYTVSYIVPGMYYRIYWRNNKKRQQENGVFCLASSQGSDSGETPLFVGFSNLGNIVGQLKSPYEGYTHFLRHYVADKIMNEPQSGTITFGLSTSSTVFQSIEPRNILRVQQYSRVLNPKINCEYGTIRSTGYWNTASNSSIPQYTKPKYCECMKHLKYFLSKKSYSYFICSQILRSSICEKYVIIVIQNAQREHTKKMPGDLKVLKAYKGTCGN